ncbi:PREDICTED: jerky protein homolog-like [Rhagoletis zephyria]|uniref:jerky protein homolog-like n=1 Tax=Rhagoletis zephyria TaxID=28612 RepID=UPI00081145F8|nr:PREDICTED: jerky protein homolog-like [Rhagoletis zephyria]
MSIRKRNVHQEEKCAPGRKVSKERITFLVCANAEGTKRIEPFVIGKAQNPRSFRNKILPVKYDSSKSAWMNAAIFKKCFFGIFAPEVERFLEDKMLPKMALLLLNNAPSHPPADQLVKETEDGKIWVMYFPPNVTPLIQPMDQNAIRLLKLHYRTSLLSMVVTSVESLETCLKQTNLFQAVSLLALAWKKVSQESLKKCWNRIFNDDEFDEEDDVPLSILQQSEENLATRNSLRLLERVFPNVQFDVNDVTEWNNENIIDDILTFNDHDEEETIVAPAEMPKSNERVNVV